ncbi:putative RNA-directed DNA polymerase, eukaryota, reverse transcriptase zinc-binding domain protein [Tanacetum coccineum]
MRLSSIDTKIDQGLASESDLCDRRESIRILGEFDKREASDIAQKSRIKWALEGDENSNFFHASLKKNRRQQSIKGIRRNGEWIENPYLIKEEFKNHFQNRFQRPNGFPPTSVVDMVNRLPHDQSEFLERDISRDEIKRAVWDCGGDRCNSSFIALIPKVSNATHVTDFRPISLIGCQYKIIGKLLANRLSCMIGSCISPEQSAFIKNRNILDGPLVLSKVMAWHRKNKKKLMVFKVDFEKAFDSLKWDFLDLVMDKIGFGCKWRSCIKGCLRNARTSVLINGSPTKEFEIFRGLRQGDPLSPFLFILAMEGLHAFIYKATNLGIFKSFSIGVNNLRISHLMYPDDVIFMGEWSILNACNLLCILGCFFFVSGLKINVHKSNLSGVGMSNEDILSMANVIGCGAATLPFKYLGVPVGCNMSRCSYWEPIINKFSSRLSLWKARLLSVRGRLTLIKSVLGSLPLYFMSLYMVPISVCKKLESMRNHFFIGADMGEKKMMWVRWKKCLASKNMGGLGIGSIFALNFGLLFKWIWRFLCNSSDVWIKVIKEMYDSHGGIFVENLQCSSLSP